MKKIVIKNKWMKKKRKKQNLIEKGKKKIWKA